MMAPSKLLPIVVRRFAHSGLYDTIAMNYLSEGVLCAWDAIGVSFVVLDAKTGEDVTSTLLFDAVTARPRRSPEMPEALVR
jgi:polyhydroxyalkanoate synthesis regulator protein